MYTKLSDSFCVHPKILRIGNEAAGAFCRMLSYCGRTYSDGELPDEMVIFCAGNKREVLDALTSARLIRKCKDGSWLIVGYLDHNLSRKQWEDRKATDRERQENKRKRDKGRESRRESRRDSDRTGER